MNEQSEVIEIDLREIFGLLWHQAWLLLLSATVGGVAGFLLSTFLITPMYESTTSVYILSKQNESTLTYSDVQLGTQLTKDYALLIKSRSVLETVMDQFGVTGSYEAFASRVGVHAQTDTRILSITVSDENPRRAMELTDAIREVASSHITNVMAVEAVNIADPAYMPKEPSSPSIPKWTLIAFALGLFLAAAIVIVKYMLDDSIKTSEDVERYLHMSTLSTIPIINSEEGKKGSKRRSITGKEGQAAIHEKSSEEDENIEDME